MKQSRSLRKYDDIKQRISLFRRIFERSYKLYPIFRPSIFVNVLDFNHYWEFYIEYCPNFKNNMGGELIWKQI